MQVIPRVKSSDLVAWHPEFDIGNLVCKAGWVGTVRSVKALLTLRYLPIESRSSLYFSVKAFQLDGV